MHLPVIHRQHAGNGFSLIEMMMVMLIVGVLTTIGASVFGKTGSSARRTAADQFAAAVEQARTHAITRRRHVALAIAPPLGNSPDSICRVGLFEVDELPGQPGDLEGHQLQRWSALPDGVIFLDGTTGGLRNVMDEEELQISWKEGRNRAQVRALVFSPRGGLVWPTGSDPVAAKIGTGNYHDGQPRPVSDGGHHSFRIGRVIARPWRLD